MTTHTTFEDLLGRLNQQAGVSIVANGRRMTPAETAMPLLRDIPSQGIDHAALRRLAMWFWSHCSVQAQVVRHHSAGLTTVRHDNITDFSWVSTAFFRSSPGSLEFSALAVLTWWTQLTTSTDFVMSGFRDRVQRPDFMRHVPGLRRALEFQEDPSWWRLCVEHVHTLDDPEYEPLVQALCMRVAPEHPYIALTQSLHASLNDVLMLPPETVHIIPEVDFQAP